MPDLKGLARPGKHGILFNLQARPTPGFCCPMQVGEYMRDWERQGTTCVLMAVQSSLLAVFAISGEQSLPWPSPQAALTAAGLHCLRNLYRLPATQSSPASSALWPSTALFFLLERFCWSSYAHANHVQSRVQLLAGWPSSTGSTRRGITRLLQPLIAQVTSPLPLPFQIR